MDRRTFLKQAGATASIGVAGIAGCAGRGAATGILATRVSDQPGDIDDFQTLNVTIEAVWVKPVDGERRRREFDEPSTADLTELTGEASALVGELELETGDYEFLQLDIAGTDATLTDGASVQVTVPGEAPLTFNVGYEIRSGQQTTFTADFTPVKRGAAGGYILQPVPQEIVVTYEDGTTVTGTNSTSTSA
ncbi:MAG: DUF4382 domain-containing protein [Halobacteriaceae archaeon]